MQKKGSSKEPFLKYSSLIYPFTNYPIITRIIATHFYLFIHVFSTSYINTFKFYPSINIYKLNYYRGQIRGLGTYIIGLAFSIFIDFIKIAF